jgi:hypothetical protein
VEPDRAIKILKTQLDELRGLSADVESAQFRTWFKSTEVALRRILGDKSHLVEDFLQQVNFWGGEFETGRRDAIAVLEAAIYDFEVIAAPADLSSGASIDQELWQHVRRPVEAEQWTQVASQTQIFTESCVRKWAGRPAEEVGASLMTAVFRPEGGEFPLGQTAGEREGWHQFARGFAAALRNVDTHRIQDRDDLKRYAIGVLGAASLLLTQLRHEHGNRFRK